jgi:hypothetical protein
MHLTVWWERWEGRRWWKRWRWSWRAGWWAGEGVRRHLADVGQPGYAGSGHPAVCVVWAGIEEAGLARFCSGNSMARAPWPEHHGQSTVVPSCRSVAAMRLANKLARQKAGSTTDWQPPAAVPQSHCHKSYRRFEPCMPLGLQLRLASTPAPRPAKAHIQAKG